MSEQNEKSEQKFIDGMWVSRKDDAPDFVVCRLSFNMDKFVSYMSKNINEKGYLSIDVKRSKAGKIYAVKDEFVPKPKEEREGSGKHEV